LDGSLVLVHHQLKNRIEIVKDYGDLPGRMFSQSTESGLHEPAVNAAHAIPGNLNHQDIAFG
jgi:hypothetical protein